MPVDLSKIPGPEVAKAGDVVNVDEDPVGIPDRSRVAVRHHPGLPWEADRSHSSTVIITFSKRPSIMFVDPNIATQGSAGSTPRMRWN